MSSATIRARKEDIKEMLSNINDKRATNNDVDEYLLDNTITLRFLEDKITLLHDEYLRKLDMIKSYVEYKHKITLDYTKVFRGGIEIKGDALVKPIVLEKGEV